MNVIALELLLSAVSIAGADWTALPTPSLCAPPPAHGHPPALWDALHVRSLAPAPDTDGRSANARLPLSTVVQMLEEDARARGAQLEFFRGSPLLFARGDAAALDGARALLAELEQQSRTLEIELKLRVRRARADAVPSDGRAEGESVLEESARVLSGEEACFGTRSCESFIESFDVEVAADSGVSRPSVSVLVTGTTLHLTAARLGQGRTIFLSGLFDQSVVAERTQFQTDTRNDLGTLDMPKVDVQQIAFAGIVENGKSLELELRPKEGAARWFVSIEARTQPERESPAKSGWAMLDLAFVARDARALPHLGPGALLGGDLHWSEDSAPGTALPPSAIAASLDEGRGTSSVSGRARASVYWTDELLFLPRADAALAENARALVRAAESLRGRASSVEVHQAGLDARFPVVSGFPARLVSGSERTYLLGYRTELAPQTWMPVPEISSAFDGVCLWLAPLGESANGAAWNAHSSPPREIPREDAHLGRMQALAREFASTQFSLYAEEPARELFSGTSALRVALHAR